MPELKKSLIIHIKILKRNFKNLFIQHTSYETSLLFKYYSPTKITTPL